VFERFTDRARRVVVLAQEEARLLNHNYIGTEHLLLGLLSEGEGVGARALVSMGVDLGGARFEVEAIIGRGTDAPSGHIPFTPRAKKVLELSLREALQLGHNYIGTEHILLGLIREGSGVAAQALTKLGVGLDVTRQRVIDMLAGEGAPPTVVTTGFVQGAAPGVVRNVVGAARRMISGCAFCGRDLYEVERIVVGDTGAMICKDCAWLAVQTMEQATGTGAPVTPLRLPPRVFGDVPDERAVEEITGLFPNWGIDNVEDGHRYVAVAEALGERWGDRTEVTMRVERIRFTSRDEAAVRFTISALPHQPFDGRAVRVGDAWKIGRETYCMVARLGGVPCSEDEPDETDGDDDDDAA
jgi:hypothetical protein